MKFGVCCNPDQAPQVIATGFDYTELPAGRNFYQGPERPRDHWQTLKVEATNLFIVGELMLVGPDKGDIRGYAENVIAKAAAAFVNYLFEKPPYVEHYRFLPMDVEVLERNVQKMLPLQQP